MNKLTIQKHEEIVAELEAVPDFLDTMFNQYIGCRISDDLIFSIRERFENYLARHLPMFEFNISIEYDKIFQNIRISCLERGTGFTLREMRDREVKRINEIKEYYEGMDKFLARVGLG